MGDFGYLSDTDDSAVEELLSQAKELSALEQVAAINCSGFTDSTLPDDLETRFRRLKSLPTPQSDPVLLSSSLNDRKKYLAHSKSVVDHPKEGRDLSGNKRNPGNVSRSMSLPDVKSGSRAELVSVGSGDFSDCGNIGSSSSREGKILSPVKKTEKLRKEKRRIGLSSSSVVSASPQSSEPEPGKRLDPKSKSTSSSWLDKLSPSKIIGYIWRSPNKSSTKKKNIKNTKSFNAAAYSSGRERNIDFDEFLSDLNEFSVEDQRKILKKALKEQERMRKEAAEIIKMTKKASARFDFDD